MSVEQRVRSHFQADARRFDAIYESEKSKLNQWIDNVWRGVVRRRYELTLELLAPLERKSLLDIGCGSGRYCIAYAERGADRVVGIDFAKPMIDLAIEHARRAGVADRCDFRALPFLEAVSDETFDACSALGFFDYVADPVPIISRMRELTRSQMIMSFPKSVEWRVPVRRLRFWLNGCPLFLYSEAKVKEILAAAGVDCYRLIELDRDYIIAADLRN